MKMYKRLPPFEQQNNGNGNNGFGAGGGEMRSVQSEPIGLPFRITASLAKSKRQTRCSQKLPRYASDLKRPGSLAQLLNNPAARSLMISSISGFICK